MDYKLLQGYMQECKEWRTEPTFLGLSWYVYKQTGDIKRVDRKQAYNLKMIRERKLAQAS